MKIKFLRAFIVAIVCLVVFLATTFVPAINSLHKADFFRGFSGGMGLVALIASVYFSIELKKERKA